ncbi:Alpha-glucosidase [Venturia inaequalis]|nr:Alpha-glucosidase [Venturia inaequalis]
MTNPALPILGSTLLNLANEKSQSRKRKRVGASFDPIDTALKGGLDYGRISCISGDKSQGKTTIAIHCLITHLLSSPTSQAAVIDTTGTFDLLRLHEVIVTRVKSNILTKRARQIGDLQPEMSPPPPPTEDAEKTAEKALERVKILRVFDFVGVVEAVGELSEELQDVRPTEENTETQPKSKPPPQRNQRTQIADSDEEEEEDSEEDMLFASPLPVPKPTSPPPQPPPNTLDRIGMIIIDNITQPLHPILKINYTRAQSLLTTFLTSLRHLTTTHNLATLLLNTATAPKSFHTYHSNTIAPQGTFVPNPLAAPPTFSDQVSIFAGTNARPALGKTFIYQLDLHLLVSSVPKRRRDAEIVVGGKSGKGELVGVIEVLGDRGDERVGMWSVFRIGKDGNLKGAF